MIALFGALSSFQLNAFGSFRCRQLCSLVEEYLAAPYSNGQVAYDLWRLLHKGFITRLAGTHSYTCWSADLGTCQRSDSRAT